MSKGVKAPTEDVWKTQPALPPLPQGVPVCISHGCAPAPKVPAVLEREGMLTSSATGIMVFLKVLWLPWAHTHPGEEASAGISSLAVWGFSREEGEAHAPVHLWVTTSDFLPHDSVT